MILTAIRLAQDVGTDFRYNWFPPRADAPTLDNPGELFTDAFMARHFIDKDSPAARGAHQRPRAAAFRRGAGR